MKIPRTPDRRITPLFGSGKFGRWPAHALVIVAHIPVPLPILRRLSAGHSPGTTRAAIINAHYSRMSGIYAARRTEDDAPRRQPRPATAAPPPCRPHAASRRPGPSRRRTLRFSGASWASASGFSKGFFNHSESNYLDAKAGFNVAARPASRFRDDTRIDIHRFDHGASSCPGHHRDRHYNAVATGAPGDTARKAR